MLSLFRKIRLRFLTNAQTRKYLAYAIGEILLVVIGILIALQINNWNEDRKDKIKSKEFHQRLVEDLNLHINTFENDLKRSKELLAYISKSVAILQQKRFNKETIDTVTYTLTNHYQFVRISDELSSYEEMKSTGQLGLIYNDAIRKKINGYLKYLEAIRKIFDQLADKVGDMRLFDPYITHYIVKGEKSQSNIEYEIEEIAKNKELINVLSRHGLHWDTKRLFSEYLLKYSKELKELLEQEIEKNL